jgi:hypothetical protein
VAVISGAKESNLLTVDSELDETRLFARYPQQKIPPSPGPHETAIHWGTSFPMMASWRMTLQSSAPFPLIRRQTIF